MTQPDETAYPFDGEIDGPLQTRVWNTGLSNEFSTTQPTKIKIKYLGLTKREYFAAMALQGLLSGKLSDLDTEPAVAVMFADALINELNKIPNE